MRRIELSFSIIQISKADKAGRC